MNGGRHTIWSEIEESSTQLRRQQNSFKNLKTEPSDIKNLLVRSLFMSYLVTMSQISWLGLIKIS